MEVISFDISGKFAHFRRFYSNSTALSFTIPPRTTLMGIVAAFMGREKESYYEELSSDNILLGVAVKSRLKKSFHRLNLLKITSTSDFRGAKGRTQIPLEVVTCEDLRTDDLTYRVFIGCTENGKVIFEDLKQKLLHHETQYTTTLGLANFTATIKNVMSFDASNVQVCETSNNEIELHSAGNTADINELLLDSEHYNFIEEDLLPADFKGNKDREVISMNRLIFTINDIPLKVDITGTYYQLTKNGKVQNIQFLKPVS